MRLRLRYFLFVACILLLALSAPVFLFALKDRFDHQTVYAENQEITVSGFLTNNYIEDDEERYTTFLYQQSQGVEYAVMELDSTLSEYELAELLMKANLSEDYDLSFLQAGIISVASRQYAVYNTEDHSDIIFLLTLITLQTYSYNPDVVEDDRYDSVRILVDSQTGMLYFMGVYYARDYYEDYGDYGDLFSNDSDMAVAAYQDIVYRNIPDLYLSCADLLGLYLSPFLDDWIGDVSFVTERKDSTFTEADVFADLARTSGFLTGVEFTIFHDATTFPVSFAVYTSDGSSYVTVSVTAQYSTYTASYQESDFTGYQCSICIGLEDMVFLLPEFNYWKPSVG